MKKVLRILFNKYLIATAVFLAWVLVLDQADWFSQKAQQKQLQDVKDRIAFLDSEVTHMQADYSLLMRNPEQLERYAREHYHMKKPNEDLYVIEKK